MDNLVTNSSLPFLRPATETMNSAGFMTFAGSILSMNSYVFDTLRIIILGTLIEAGRKLFEWLAERCTFRYAVTVEFNEGDQTYPWIIQFLAHHEVWRRSKSFQIGAKTSRSRLGVSLSKRGNPLADYIPVYDVPQIFYWRGYFLEVRCDRNEDKFRYDDRPQGRIYISVFSLDVSVVDALVEEARELYTVVAKSNVTVHAADSEASMFHPVWNNVKHKVRRPISSVVLRDGTLESLLGDIREFLGAEDWYVNAGIPYRRGYLLHGPPGTGKSSTIYALAGELNLEIYTLSLGSKFVDDSYLHRAISGVPRGSIFLIEDIDCCFTSREEDEEVLRLPRMDDGYEMTSRQPKSQVTMSALLNVIDGVCSEDGVIFIATTNYFDRLDPALLRPGRVDHKVEYSLTSHEQAEALFQRFYPQPSPSLDTDDEKNSAPPSIATLAKRFADGVPELQFSTAELQGYLLFHKTNPEAAVGGIKQWVEGEMTARREREDRERLRKEKLEARLIEVRRSVSEGATDKAPSSSSSGEASAEPVDTSAQES